VKWRENPTKLAINCRSLYETRKAEKCNKCQLTEDSFPLNYSHFATLRSPSQAKHA
jgi:hypothetical protein